jgi:cobalt-zinc-cadmium efflux system outer membrane protein
MGGISPSTLAAPPQADDVKVCELKTSLETFRAHALAHSPLVAEIDSTYAAQLAQAIDTELLTNPELSAEQTYTRMNIGGSNDPQSGITFSQPLKLSNFGKRDKVAELLRKAGGTKRDIQLLEFTQQITVQFYTLFSLQESVRILQQAERIAASKVIAVGKQVQAGLLSQGSEALFQGEKFRLEAQRAGAEAALATLRSELSMAIGTECTVIATQPPATAKIPATSTLLEKARASRISEQARLDVIQELTTEQVRLAELDAFPSIAPRFVYQHTNDGGDFYGAGFTLPIPVWNRNQAQITKTTAEREVAARKSALVHKGGLELQVSTAQTAAVSSEHQVETYFSNVEPAFKAALQAEERSYASGKGTVMEVWQTFRALNEAQLTAQSLRQQAAMARARLSILVGEEV